MTINLHRNFPVLIIDNQIKENNIEGMALKTLIAGLENKGLAVIALELVDYQPHHVAIAGSEVSCVVLGWNKAGGRAVSRLDRLIDLFRDGNRDLPIFLLTDKLEIKNIPLDALGKINGYIWKGEDTPDFIAGRIENAAKKYLDSLLPPFFKALLKYTEEYKYSWHTPGHMGGIAFLKSPAGRIFHAFFGENVFRSDLSVSVSQLGSLLDHNGALQEAENKAAKIFGADRTYFVTNGTSTANRIVLQATVTQGDIVLVDRNCHKSIMHAIIITGAVPIYLRPVRNKYGIIGPVPAAEMTTGAIEQKMKSSPLIGGKRRIKITIITNSTYDGLCYHMGIIKDHLQQHGAGLTENILFDEAWFAYARFNPLYINRCATYNCQKDPAYNLIFATHSTHKLLAAFSQASMIHVLDQRGDFSHARFNEAFMMHTSTSPQYGIIASLDMAAKMMDGNSGRQLTHLAIEEANIFRKTMVKIGKELAKRGEWWFKVWQPPGVAGQDFDQVSDRTLNDDPACWLLGPKDDWHGFPQMVDRYAMLDPTKVTVLTLGLDTRRDPEPTGIPAPVVARFLSDRGIVAEKTGFYSFLFLFSIGVTNGKSGTLLAGLFDFKKTYAADPPLAEVFPDLAGRYPAPMDMHSLCRKMHAFVQNSAYAELFDSSFTHLPEQHVTPAEAYRELAAGRVKPCKIRELAGKTAAVMVVPYPPGIPVIMPGEKFNPSLVSYMRFYEGFNRRFPGFGSELHGVSQEGEEYSIHVLK